MSPFEFSLNAVSPIILMVAFGYFLKKINLIDEKFAKMANKLVFRAFLPVMLFMNVYKIESAENIGFLYIAYTLGSLFFVFLITIPLVSSITLQGSRRGALLQGIFRSNYALIGVPLASALCGAAGGATASVLAAALIPFYNVLAVISLTVFRGNSGAERVGVSRYIKKILLGIVGNPLIIAIASGVFVLLLRKLSVSVGVYFRLSDIAPIYSVLNSIASLATPLALIVLGAQFEFSVVGGMLREIIFATFMKTLAVPALLLALAYLVLGDSFSGAHFAAMIAAFATPVAVSSVPMAQEMGADAELAGQLVVWTTLVSTVSIFGFTFIFKLLGVF